VSVTANALDEIAKILQNLENDIAAPLESRSAALEKLKGEVWKAWWECCIKKKDTWETTAEDSDSEGGITEMNGPGREGCHLAG